jgi:ABC-2 type transport system ATP-binding protein
MQLMTGRRVPTSGQARAFGRRPYENDGVLRRICFVEEGQRYPGSFRVRDAVESAGRLFQDWDADLAAAPLADLDLPRNRPVKRLSRGIVSAVGIISGWPRGRH